MRKNIKNLIAGALILLQIGLVLGGCGKNQDNATNPNSGQTTEENQDSGDKQEDSKEEGYIKFDKYFINEYIETYMKPNEAVYKKLVDAVGNYETQVILEGTEITEDELTKINDAIISRGELPYVGNFNLGGDGKTINIIYTNAFNKETALKYKEDYIKKAEYIMNEVVDIEASETEQVAAVYEYLATNTIYDLAFDATVQNDILITEVGSCTSFAYAMRNILDQLGIENHLAFSKDQSHVWNIVKMDGNYYHVDATWACTNKEGELSFANFGNSDNVRMENFPDGWYGGGNSKYPTYELPKCENTKFDFLTTATYDELNYEKHEFLYVNDLGESRSFNIVTGDNSLLDYNLDTGNNNVPNDSNGTSNIEDVIQEGLKIKEILSNIGKDEIREMQNAFLPKLNIAYDEANMNQSFRDAFNGDMKQEYANNIEDKQLKDLVNMTYDAGFKLLKDVGYVYPVIDENK